MPKPSTDRPSIDEPSTDKPAAGKRPAKPRRAARMAAAPDPAFELSLLTRSGGLLCGVDEAGRGPWAGPVVAAAVMLDPAFVPPGLADSKLLSERAREALFEALVASARIGIAFASVARIDRTDIRQATLWAMSSAVAALPGGPAPRLIAVDGRDVPPGLPCPGEAVVDGDAKSLSIAAASIVAKVTRDRMMTALAETTPGYDFERHKGYGTAAHQAALAAHGVTPHHRRTFAPIRRLLAGA